MRSWPTIVAALLIISGVGFAPAQPSNQAVAQADAGWIALFDGKNLDNWNQIGDANWRIDDGAVVADKGKGYLVSKNSYTDFQIRVEFWASDDANSGVFIRCTDPNDVSGKTAYEVNIFDQR